MEGLQMIYPVVIYFCSFLITAMTQDYEVTFSLLEEEAKDTVFGNIASKTQLLSSYSEEEFRSFQYHFLGTSENQHLFKIDSMTSELSVAKRIDRESECQELLTRNCILQFNVGVRSPRPDFFIFIAVKVIVEDKNDHSPRFLRNEISLNVSESSVVGSEFPVDAATDLDSGINGIQSYELTPASETFGLRVMTKLDGSFELKIVVNALLDRETKDLYRVQIVAKDGSNVQGILNINISVIDTNDNSPEFEHMEYNATVREDAEVGKIIVKVIAMDKDAGHNGQLTYLFSDHTFGFEEVSLLFSINQTTGEVYVAGELKYKPGKRYIIFIEASDQGKPFRVSQTVLNIDIVDSGNNPPVILVNLLSPANVKFVNISEASENGTFIAHVNVEDSDTGPNAQVSCHVPSPKFDIQILGNGYIIVLRSQLDREISNSHTVMVICQDQGNPPLTANASFLVMVADENDNKPEFTQNSYSTTLKENNKKGAILTHVSAHDRDAVSTPNSEIRYFIESGANLNFSINPNTGIVSTNTVLDREITQEITFLVFAEDQGRLPKTGTTTINVKVLDENDNAPQFPSNDISLEILENGTMDTIVGKINATDADEGENGQVTFYISEKFKLFIPFIVYPDGVVRSSEKLNREQQGKYNFIVIAKDQGNPSMNSSVFVTVNVLDINDMSPVIEFPNNWNNTVTISHNAAVNSVITKIKAYDLDQGKNKVLKYSIEDGNEDQIFSVNSETGVVLLAKQYQIKSDMLFPLMICVKDSGSPERLTRTQLNIVLAVIPGESSNKYIIISVVVVVVTVVISAALITGICFLRRNDRQRQQHEQRQEHKDNKESVVPTDSGSSNFIKNTNEQNQNDINTKYKKEVSFSFSDNIGKTHGEINNSTAITSENNSLKYPKMEKNSNLNEQEETEQLERECQLKVLKMHTFMMDPETGMWGGSEKHQVRDAHRPHYEDSHSETSGETTTSDSGRGGSEDEITTPSCSHNNSRLSVYPYHFPPTFNVSSKLSTSIQHSQFQPSVPVLSSSTNINNKQRHVSEQHINKNKRISQPLLHIPKQAITPQQLYSVHNVMECYPNDSTEWSSYLRGTHNVCYSRQESLSTQHSHDDDDDDAATTTSGSYTINPEELNDDIDQLQRDMFV